MNTDFIGESLITENEARAFVREWREQMANPVIPESGRAFILLCGLRQRFGIEWRLNEKRLREMRVIFSERRKSEEHQDLAYLGRWRLACKASALYADFAVMVEKLTGDAAPWHVPRRRAVTLPSGRRVGLGEYAAAIRDIKARPDREFLGWAAFPVMGRDILAAFREGVHDRINQGIPAILRGLPGAPASRPILAAVGRDDKRVWRRLARKVESGAQACDCRWCGSSLPTWQAKERRFCGSECRQSYFS